MIGIGLAGAATAAEPSEPGRACLLSGEMSEAVSSRRVIAPAQAIRIARDVAANADVLRASLCRDGPALVYRILALRRDGRAVRVTVDAPSGKVLELH